MWNCIERGSGYCNGEPDFDKPSTTRTLERGEGKEHIVWGTVGGSCKLNHETCGRYSKTLPGDDIDRGSTLKITITKPDGKSSSKKSKKEKTVEEVKQGTLF